MVTARLQENVTTEISSSTEGTQRTNWGVLPNNLQDIILARLSLRNVFQFQSISKSYLDISNQLGFQQSRLQRARTEGSFSPMALTIDSRRGIMHCIGFDLNANNWKRLPSVRIISPPDPDFFKVHLVAGSGGLLCVNVSKQPGVEQIIICNPLTTNMRKLPPMNFPS